MIHSRQRSLLAGLVVGMLACSNPPASPGESEARVDQTSDAEPSSPTRRRIDVHVHLVDGAVDELLAALDRAQIEAAVVMATPHLDPAQRAGPSLGDPFSGWRESNDRVLELSAGHRDRLLPFITADPAAVEVAELERWFAQGACGVKLYMGHHNLRARPLADPAHRELFAMLEREAIPVLVHVNTFRFEAELDELLAMYPKLKLVCPHFCGSRTDIDRLERLLARHPTLLVDTSHGPGEPGIAGFENLSRERDRVRALIEAQPTRFLFGSDLVTLSGASVEDTRTLWDRQLDANLGLLERERFEFPRVQGGAELASYRGLALSEPTAEALLHDNAERWLATCLE